MDTYVCMYQRLLHINVMEILSQFPMQIGVVDMGIRSDSTRDEETHHLAGRSTLNISQVIIYATGMHKSVRTCFGRDIRCFGRAHDVQQLQLPLKSCDLYVRG
jgi:hypothetical protein